MDARRIAYYMGSILAVSSATLIAPGVYGLILYLAFGRVEELYPASVMLVTGLIYTLIGYLLTKLPREPLSVAEGVFIASLVWIVVPALQAVSFMLALQIPYIDALFESVSGFTTTGLTILTGQPSSWGNVYVPEVSAIPETLKLWRTLIQWLGGIGIIVVTVAFLAPPGVSAAFLYLGEGRSEKLDASSRNSALKMFAIYAVLTSIGAILLWLSGMTVGDAIHHSMTAIATGGFSTHTENMGYYKDKPWVLFSAAVIMLMGAMNFIDHYYILTLRLRKLKDSVETHAQYFILAIALLIAFSVWFSEPAFQQLYSSEQVWFNLISVYTTTGFQAGDINTTPDAYKFLITILALVGGSVLSTAGGIKVLRILIAAKSVTYEADVALHHAGYVPKKKLGRYNLTEDTIRKALATITAFIATYTIIVLAILALYPGDYQLGDVMFEVASALGDVGASAGITSAAAPVGVKSLLIIAMDLGRLEVSGYIVALLFLLRGR